MNRVASIARALVDHSHAEHSKLIIVEVARVQAAKRPPWWGWATFLAAAMTCKRIDAIIATGADPFAKGR